MIFFLSLYLQVSHGGEVSFKLFFEDWRNWIGEILISIHDDCETATVTDFTSCPQHDSLTGLAWLGFKVTLTLACLEKYNELSEAEQFSRVLRILGGRAE